MRIYYVMEARGRRCHVLSALGVDARAWNRLHRRVREWRRHLELRHGIPADAELRASGLQTTAAPSEPHCACDCHAPTDSPQIVDVVGQGLRVVEDLAAETGGVQVVNVCLNMDETPAYRRVALDRLFNRVNATAARGGMSTPSSSSGKNPTRRRSAPTKGCAATTRCPCVSAPATTAGTPATFPSTG